MKANKHCRYGRSHVNADYILEIAFDSDITICTQNTNMNDLMLDKSCIGIFIDAMQKHYDLVNQHKCLLI